MKKKNNNWTKLHLIALALGLIFSNTLSAQQQDKPFKGHFYDKKENVHLYLDLYQATLQVPSLEFLGRTHGYMQGNIYGIWLLTQYKIKDDTATLRLSHDSGADSQSVVLQKVNDSTLIYNTVNGNAVRRVHKRKLVKAPFEFTFTRVK